MSVNAVDVNIHMILKSVASALQLDGNNSSKEAYVSYLQSVQEVVRILLQDASRTDVPVSANTKKCIRLGQQCMERAANLLENMPTSGLWEAVQQPKVETLEGIGPLPQATLPTKVSYVNDKSVSPTLQSTPISPGTLDLPQLPTPTRVLQTDPMRSNQPSPLEQARRQNQQLVMAYRSRLSQLAGKASSATNMSLSLQRKMAENMAIAQAREEAILKKMQERQLRLDQEAAKRIVLTAGMSKDEQERRKIYTHVHMYEADTKWLQWRQQLLERPADTQLIQDLIAAILETSDHPLTLMLNRLQYDIYDKLRPIVLSYIHELHRIQVPYIPSPTEPNLDESPRCQSPKAASINPGTVPTEGCPVRHPHKASPSPRATSPQTSKDMSQVVQETKQNIEEAIERGKQLAITMSEQAKEDKKLLAAGREQEQHQFDDLFDIDDDDTYTSSWGDTRIRNEKDLKLEEVKGLHWEMDIVNDLANITDQEKLTNLKKESLARHMSNMTFDVRDALDKLQATFIVAYDMLDSAVGRDQCYASLEGPFFGPLWPYLLSLYRLANYDQEVQMAKTMTKLLPLRLCDLGVRDKFGPPPGGVEVPYSAAIEELQQLVKQVSPLTKLECMVRICRVLCQYIETYSQQKGYSEPPALGADDLLPILSYVAIQSKAPQLVSECQAMEEFIHEGYLIAEEGYCLTSLQTALNFIVSKEEY